MRTVSSYGVEIRKQNIPARQTMEIYRQAVGYLTEIYAQVWEELRKIPETKKRFNTAEHMVHMTKKNTARFDFDLRFPKMPSYLRRSAIQHALGSVSSYETRLGQWKETGVLSGRPKLTCRNHAMPVFYRDVMYREGGEGKDEAYLKLYDGGKLPSLAGKIGDGGQYINQLQYKFSSDAANWVWNTDTVNAKIDELICEYEIVEISNRILTKNTTFADTIRAWVDKLSQICIAYSVIKNELGDAKPFYEMLCSLYKQRNLLDSQKKPFLALLQENANTFKQFMAAQSSLFMKACSYYLDDLSEEDAKAILDDDTYGFGSSYLLEPDKYTSKVQKAVTAYKNAQKYTQLKKHWLDLTGTDSPYAWSNKYGMPILAMVPDAEMSIARKVFGFINSKTKDEESITTAEDYLSKITYADKLSSKSERDKAFRDVFLGDYTILFDDVDEVIDYLKSHVTESPYHWMGSKEVSVKIKEMANANYVKSGYSEAKQVIDNMPVDQLKDYLKKLIEDNIAVGVEIIKGQK